MSGPDTGRRPSRGDAIPELPEALKKNLDACANVVFARLGYSPLRTSDAKREAWWWLSARLRAAERRTTRLFGGSAVTWTASGRSELLPIEVAAAGPGEVTVEVLSSTVSPGTERAQLLRLPGVNVSYPMEPGYSAAGRAIAVGAGVRGIRVGDAVAASGATHASVVTLPGASVYPVPAGVSPAAAGMVQLGVIAAQGVHHARIAPGEAVCVVGAGLVGALAQRIAVAEGAGPVTVVATSRRREPAARRGGAAAFLLAEPDRARIEGLEAPVVIEATGEPAALALAVAAAGEGARVVLLGSTRGVVPHLPVEIIRRKRLRLIGAHVNTLRHQGERTGENLRRREAEGVLALLARGALAVEDLLERSLDPRESGAFYRELGRGAGIVGARFDWTLLPERERARPGSVLRLPSLGAGGVAIDERPLRPGGRRRAAPHASGDPLAGAVGHLRIGLLGCGDIAVQNAAAIAAAPNTVLTACFDPNAALAEDIARAHGAAVAPTAEALLERDDVDAVFLAVPHHLHAPLVQQAAAAGRHVMVEKPPANDLGAAREMAAAAERAGVVLSICFPQRYLPHVVAARRLIGEGAIGRFAGSLTAYFEDKPPAYWRGGFSGRSHSSWRTSREQAGGGVLIMNLSHHIDLVRHLVGIDAEAVSAMAAAVDSPAEVEDTINLGIRYANGAVGSLVGCSAVRGGRGTELRLWGEHGMVVLEPNGRVYTLRALDGLRTTRWQTLGDLPAVNIRAVYVSRFASAIAEGRAPDITAADGLAVQAFIEAAYLSVERGETVRPADLLLAAPA